VPDDDDFPIPAGREMGMGGATFVADANMLLRIVERNHILRVLEAHGWQIRQSVNIWDGHGNIHEWRIF
jgi:hypothetical protein